MNRSTKKAPAPRRPARNAAAPKPRAARKRNASAKAVIAAPAGKQKTVRDSFNMPTADYDLIGVLKKRALGLSVEVKKSELLRAGLRVLAAMADEPFKATLAAVPRVKKGRPGKKK